MSEIIGAELPDHAGEDSQSFARLLADPLWTHDRLPLINHAANGRFAITEGTWKLIMPHQRAKSELYNLATDPGEESDLIDQHPEIAGSLEKKITNIVLNGRTTDGTRQPNDTDYWSDLTWIQKAEYNSGHENNTFRQ